MYILYVYIIYKYIYINIGYPIRIYDKYNLP